MLSSSARTCKGALITREVAEGMSLLEVKGSPPAPLAASMNCVEGPVTERSEMTPWWPPSPRHSVNTNAVEVMFREKRVRGLVARGTPQGAEGRNALPSTARPTAMEEGVLGGVTKVEEVESAASGVETVGNGRERMVQLLLPTRVDEGEVDVQKDAVNVVFSGVVPLPPYVGEGAKALVSASDRRWSLGAKLEDANKALNVEGVEAIEEVEVKVREEKKCAGALPLDVGVSKKVGVTTLPLRSNASTSPTPMDAMPIAQCPRSEVGMTMATIGGSTKPVNGAGKAGACRTNTRRNNPPGAA